MLYYNLFQLQNNGWSTIIQGFSRKGSFELDDWAHAYKKMKKEIASIYLEFSMISLISPRIVIVYMSLISRL